MFSFGKEPVAKRLYQISKYLGVSQIDEHPTTQKWSMLCCYVDTSGFETLECQTANSI